MAGFLAVDEGVGDSDLDPGSNSFTTSDSSFPESWCDALFSSFFLLGTGKHGGSIVTETVVGKSGSSAAQPRNLPCTLGAREAVFHLLKLFFSPVGVQGNLSRITTESLPELCFCSRGLQEMEELVFASKPPKGTINKGALISPLPGFKHDLLYRFWVCSFGWVGMLEGMTAHFPSQHEGALRRLVAFWKKVGDLFPC